jgi:hypothetical protein
MKSDDTPMYDDPTTPMHVREMIAAGRRGTSDYDVERGLAEHLIRIGAVFPTAPVAPPLAPPLAPSTHWAPAATTAVKSHLPAWFGFVALPLAAAGVAGLLWLFSADRAAAPKTRSASSAAAAPTAMEVGASAQPNVAPSEAAGVRVPSARGAAPPSSAAVERSVAAAEDREARAADDARYDRRSRGSARPSHTGARVARGANGRAFDGDSELGSSSGVAAASDVNGSDSSRSSAAPADATDKSNAADEARTSLAANAAASSARHLTKEAEKEPAEEAAEPEAPAKASRQANAKPPAPVIDESRLEREMQMLAVTQRVLSSDPGRALRLSEQGEREFAGSMFSAERRQLGLLALVKLGRIDEARRAGRPFLAKYPNAPWSERLRRALTTGVVE